LPCRANEASITVQGRWRRARLGAPASRGGPKTSLTPPIHDLMANGHIDNTDLDIATGGWSSRGRAAPPATPNSGLDGDEANNDGCIDIVDVQAVFAARGDAAPVGTNARCYSQYEWPADGQRRCTRADHHAVQASSTGPNFVVDSTLDNH
jgi:hypothetical protein